MDGVLPLDLTGPRSPEWRCRRTWPWAWVEDLAVGAVGARADGAAACVDGLTRADIPHGVSTRVLLLSTCRPLVSIVLRRYLFHALSPAIAYGAAVHASLHILLLQFL